MFKDNQGYRQCILCRRLVASSCFKWRIKRRRRLISDEINTCWVRQIPESVKSDVLVNQDRLLRKWFVQTSQLTPKRFYWTVTGSSPQFTPYLLNKRHPSSSTTKNSWSFNAAPFMRLHDVAHVHRDTHFKKSSYSQEKIYYGFHIRLKMNINLLTLKYALIILSNHHYWCSFHVMRLLTSSFEETPLHIISSLTERSSGNIS
jgi:hypothetical protein